MTDKRITDLAEIVIPASDDMLVAVDTSDTTQSAEGTTKKISIETLFNNTNFFGWANYADSQYTEASPLSIVGGVRTLLPNNTLGSGTNEDYINEESSLYSDNAVTPIAPGDAYDIRVGFKANTAGTERYLTLDLDIGFGSPILVYDETRRLIRGSGVENSFVFAIPVFALQTFVDNGGKFYITGSHDMDIYDIRIFITKTYRALS